MGNSVTNTNRHQQQRTDVILMALVWKPQPLYPILMSLLYNFPCSAVRPSSFANTSTGPDFSGNQSTNTISLRQHSTIHAAYPRQTRELLNPALNGCSTSCCHTFSAGYCKVSWNHWAYSDWVPISSTDCLLREIQYSVFNYTLELVCMVCVASHVQSGGTFSGQNILR